MYLWPRSVMHLLKKNKKKKKKKKKKKNNLAAPTIPYPVTPKGYPATSLLLLI
jgi:hypothetical protein